MSNIKRYIKAALLTLSLCNGVAHASIFVVTNTNDSGAGSLRQAILDANAAGGANIIKVSIGNAGTQQSIKPAFPLPVITGQVVIDATSQGLGSALPLVELDGTQASAVTLSPVDGFSIQASNCVISGFVINSFSGNGIGIYSGSSNRVVGNYIGTEFSGLLAKPNRRNGIFMPGSNANAIGGTAARDRNVISGNLGAGVSLSTAAFINPASTSGGIVFGNYIGVASDGASALGNGGAGVDLDNASGTLIGGNTPEAANIIGFNADGILIHDGAHNNFIQGNLIGVASDGSRHAGNLRHGIAIKADGTNPAEAQTVDNLIGGTNPGTANTIMFNGSAGVAIFALPAPQSAAAPAQNGIVSNSIFMNGRANPAEGLGIDLVLQSAYPNDDGPTPDTPGSPHTGPNRLQSFPVLSVATGSSAGYFVSGSLESAANQNYRIEIFGNDSPAEAGFGEGQHFLGFFNVTTDGSGHAAFSGALPLGGGGAFLSATATDAQNNTSEFSALLPTTLPAASVNQITVNNNVSSYAVFTVSLSAPSPGAVEISYNTSDGSALAGRDYLATSGTLTFAAGESVKTVAVPIIGTALDENDETFSLNLVNPVNATVAAAQGVALIKDVNTPNSAPQITSAPWASPNPAVVGQVLTFTVSAADPGGDALSFQWQFGDGTTGTGALATHSYAAPGNYVAVVTVSDATGFSTTGNVGVTVSEQAATLLANAKLLIRLNFAKANSDSLMLSGTLVLPPGPLVAGTVLSVNVGGVSRNFTLDANGKAHVGSDSVTLVAGTGNKARTANLKIKLARDNFATTLAQEGLTDADTTAVLQIPISVSIAGRLYETLQTQVYQSQAGKSGIGRDAR